MVNKTIAVIPARGNSKRIPRKNIIEFFGKPLIAWTIEAAQESKIFDKIIVSTDDPEIAEIARKYGAEIPFMRERYTDDYTPISLVTIDALHQISESFGIVVQLMANCPLRNGQDIQMAHQHFISQNVDYQISCFKFGWMNPWWAHRLDEKYQAKPIFEEDLRNHRSQDQPSLFCPTGAIWIAKTEKLLEAETFYGKDYTFFPMPWTHAVDIDNYDDLEMAKALYQMKIS